MTRRNVSSVCQRRDGSLWLSRDSKCEPSFFSESFIFQSKNIFFFFFTTHLPMYSSIYIFIYYLCLSTPLSFSKSFHVFIQANLLFNNSHPTPSLFSFLNPFLERNKRKNKSIQIKYMNKNIKYCSVYVMKYYILLNIFISFNRRFWKDIYQYIYVRVCVCVCLCEKVGIGVF